jgi:tetratricopeptide (TPR) repeat protein
MPQSFTPDQLEKLQALGINIKTEIKLPDEPIIKTNKSPVFPLLSISGLTILSLSGLILLKGKTQDVATNIPDNPSQPIDTRLTPTQVPKSIQHYLLTSQQFFSQAIQSQQDQTSTVELLNKSILAATDAIKAFPQDYRGYQQRGKIYQALTDSKPELLNQSISDLANAQKLNKNSAEITHTLASLYAKKGDAQNTIFYLNQTVALEPTKAQNFYDLAKIQQQAGLLHQALETYNRLIPLVTDSTQKIQVESEKSALEKLISQNPNPPSTIQNLQPTIEKLPSNLDSPTIQASTNGGLIVAAPDEGNKIQVQNLTDSNSLSGNSILSANQKEIIISNTQINSTSQVYITATKGGKNQNIQVLGKSEKSFTIGLDSPISEDIEFKWWIIN